MKFCGCSVKYICLQGLLFSKLPAVGHNSKILFKARCCFCTSLYGDDLYSETSGCSNVTKSHPRTSLLVDGPAFQGALRGSVGKCSLLLLLAASLWCDRLPAKGRAGNTL